MSWKNLKSNNTVATYDNLIAKNEYIHNLKILDNVIKEAYNFGTKSEFPINIGRNNLDISMNGNLFIKNLTVKQDISFNLPSGKEIKWVGLNNDSKLDISCSEIEISGNISINSKVIDLSGDVSFNGEIDALKINKLIVDDISSNKLVIELSNNIVDTITDNQIGVVYWKDSSFNIGIIPELDYSANYLLKFKNSSTTFDAVKFPWSDISSGFIYWDTSENKFSTI